MTRAILFFVAIYLYAFPYFGELKSADERPRVLLTQEIVDRGVFHLDHRVPELASTMALAKGQNFHFFPHSAPGVSFLAIPGYLVCKAFGATSLRACTWVFRVTSVIIPSLLFLFAFYRLAGRFCSASEEPARRTALAAYALGSPALLYGLLFLPYQPAAAFAGSAFVAAVTLARGEAQRAHLMAALVGFLAGMAVLMEYQAALAAVAVLAYLFIRTPRRLLSSLFAILGALPPLAALGLYQAVCFGAPWRTGFNSAVDPTLQDAYMGIVGPNGQSFAIIVFEPSSGLLILMPWLILAVVGGVAIARDARARARVGAEAIFCATLFATYVLFQTSLAPAFVRGDWSVGPRFMTIALPFVGWLAVAGFAAADRRAWTRVLALGSVVVGVVVFMITATTYPHWPDALENPLYELAFRLLSAGHTVHSLGTLVGLRGLWAALPLYLLALGGTLWLFGRGRGGKLALQVGLACLLATTVLAAYGTFPRSGIYADRAWSFVMATWEPK